MARLKLGSKPDAFYLDGQTWLCSTGLPSDVIIEVGDTSFHLHKFPLLSRSGLLENLIGEFCEEEHKKCSLCLDDIPGGPGSFLLAAKFCYGVRVELTASNVVTLRCAAEHLRMTEDYGEANLVSQTENFLQDVLSNWTDSIQALRTCEEVLSLAEELHIVSRCISSLATKALLDSTLFWNGITMESKAFDEDWWYDDVSSLRLSLYKRLILEIRTRGMKPETISGSIMHYTNRHLQSMGKETCSIRNSYQTATGTDENQRTLLEEIVELLPRKRGITSTNFLLKLLRKSMMLQASASCRENLEKLAGAQLDQALLQDLLIPNMGYSIETLYDIDCVQRMLDHFVSVECEADCQNLDTTDDDSEYRLMEGCRSLTPLTMVATLIDSYLAEIAPDVSLRLPKFESLAAGVPDYARPLADGIYRAIDIYLKAHPWLTDSEREQVCRLMNCQKLSLEASTHAAQNERLPLRVIVQVLFFEQLRLRTSIAGWFFASDSTNNLQNSSNLVAARTEKVTAEVKDRVSEIEKECLSMKRDLEKLVKAKGVWNILFRRFRFNQKQLKPKPSNPNAMKPAETNHAAGAGTAVLEIENGKDNEDRSDYV